MKRFALFVFTVLCLSSAAYAQTGQPTAVGGKVVSSCGGSSLTVGASAVVEIKSDGTLCTVAGAGGGGGGAAYTTVTTTMQNAATANGNGTVLAVDGQALAVLTVNCSSCSGGTQVNFEAEQDGTNFTSVSALPIGATPTAASSTTTAGLTYWQVPVAGFKQLRARISAYSAGTVTVTGTTLAAGVSNLTVVYNTVDANLSQVGGSSVATAAAGVQKVAIVDSSGSTIAASTDACDGSLATTVAISQTASTKVISAAAAKKNYICKLVLVAGAAEIVNIVEGTGSTCGTGTVALVGSTTAANGLSFAANGGLSATGGGTAIPGTGTNVDTCLTQSGSNRVAGWLTYVQQ